MKLDLRREILATAKRKGLSLAEYTERVFRAALKSEHLDKAPGFLEAWEKMLEKFAEKK